MASLALVIASDRVYTGEKEDAVTPLVESMSPGMGLELAFTAIVPNNASRIRMMVKEAAGKCDVVLVIGGTGPSPRDITIEAVKPLASKELPGFGEEFRRRSYSKVGARGLLSRASCLVVGKSLVFVVPGSPDAVKTALEVIGELYGHALHQVKEGMH